MNSNKVYPDKLKTREEAPYFSLPSSRKEEISLWQFKQKRNLIIIFYHGSKCTLCQKKLEEYSKIYEQAKELEAEILAISFDSTNEIEDYMRKIPLPFPVLSDNKQEVAEKYTYKDYQRNSPVPSVFITDRFGVLYYQKISREATELPSGKEILDWLIFMNIQCPECSHL